ncbi:MAG: hypothetical protein JNK53_03090 [Phycisphaerae bacterium]|nr:hypothetical protein [Phycisphaerae bacterium]
MKTSAALALFGVCSLAASAGSAGAAPSVRSSADGPDVIVGSIDGVATFGAVTAGEATVMAYAFGSTECNVGTLPYAENGSTNQHAVIAQNLYRIKDGVLEQIGMSWVKHTVCALQGSLCGACQPVGSGCASGVGVGCSSPTSSSSSGTQQQLGPRSQVNPSTGAFAFPLVDLPPVAATVGRRCQVNAVDLDPALNAGASYLAECLYIQPQDALAGNGSNNASCRGVSVGPIGTGGARVLVLTGPTLQQQCAVHAWQAAEPGVAVTEVHAADGLIVVGQRVTARGAGLWHYEYAIFNMNSDAGVGSVSVPVPAGVTVTAQQFRDVHAHSGEPYATADWAMQVAAGQATWATEPFADNPNANALRWGVLYNFRFDANAPPTSGSLALGAFKTAESLRVAALVPGVHETSADLNNDGFVNGADLGMLLSAWGDCTGCAADLSGDGQVSGEDLGALLAAWSV